MLTPSTKSIIIIVLQYSHFDLNDDDMHGSISRVSLEQVRPFPALCLHRHRQHMNLQAIASSSSSSSSSYSSAAAASPNTR